MTEVDRGWVAPVGPQSLAAVAVLHHPDETVAPHLRTARAAVDVLYVVDNTPSADGEPWRPPPDLRDVRVLAAGRNRGLGAAYDLAAARALADGYDWLLLLDQDTELLTGFTSTMCHRLQKDRSGVEAVVAVAGPGFAYSTLDASSSSTQELAETTAVVSSGSLVWLPAWREVSGFREGFIVDYVDTEYCLRVRAAGYAVVRVGDVLMRHGMGNSAPNRVLGYCRVSSNYPPLRHYYIARNFVLTARAAAGTSPAWLRQEVVRRLKFTVLSLAMEHPRWPLLRETLAGVWDGLRGREGLR